MVKTGTEESTTMSSPEFGVQKESMKDKFDAIGHVFESLPVLCDELEKAKGISVNEELKEEIEKNSKQYKRKKAKSLHICSSSPTPDCETSSYISLNDLSEGAVSGGVK